MKPKQAVIALFFTVCLLPAAAMALGLKLPNYEKRALAAPPALLAEDALNAAFPRQYEEYLSDNFAFRSYMVSANSALTYWLLGDSANDKVIAGKDGWLFLSETLDDYQRSNALSEAELGKLCDVLARQQEYLKRRGVAFLFVLAPNKNSVYGQFMPDRYARLPGPSAAEQLHGALEERGVAHAELYGALAGAKQTGLLYHRKDTHWNNYGAWVAWKEIMRAARLQVPAVPDVRDAQAVYTLERQWHGDLETMLMPAFASLDEQAVFAMPIEYKTARPMRSPEDIDITTQSRSDGPRALVFRDSFANALLPFLSNAFGYVHYTRAVPYDYALLDEDRPDIVILEIAERNLRDITLNEPILPALR